MIFDPAADSFSGPFFSPFLTSGSHVTSPCSVSSGVGFFSAMPKRYPKDLRVRAVRLVRDHCDDYAAEWEAIGSIAKKLGIGSAEMRPTGNTHSREVIDEHKATDPWFSTPSTWACVAVTATDEPSNED